MAYRQRATALKAVAVSTKPAITLTALLSAARVVTDGERWWLQDERGEWVEAVPRFLSG
jgi:hypothetical protein